MKTCPAGLNTCSWYVNACACSVNAFPDQPWLKNFDGRAEARAAEMEGLTTAKEFLAGRTALLQGKGKFDDTSLSKINFLGMH